MTAQETTQWPVLAVWLFFLAGALARGTALYWVGRGVRRADRDRRGLTDRPAVRRAEELLRRWGAPLVTLSFLTVGVQSAVNVAAGLLRMPGRRFVPALLVGAAIWATVYVTIGMAVVYAALGRLDPVWLVGAVLAVLLVVASTAYARRRTRAREP